MKKRKAIIVDLDGTLCDCKHRRKYIHGTDKIDFKHFLHPNEVSKDSLNVWCRELIDGMEHVGCEIIFVTGREEVLRETTFDWLKKYELGHCELHMRKESDYRKDAIVKSEIYNEHIKDYYDILFVVDDRKQVVDMWRSIGLIVLHCAEGNF